MGERLRPQRPFSRMLASLYPQTSEKQPGTVELRVREMDAAVTASELIFSICTK